MKPIELPATQVGEVAELARDDRVAIVEAPLSSGRSIDVGLRMMADYRVVQLVPRPVTAVGLATLAAAKHGSKVGQEIGWRARGERHEQGRRLTFATTGGALPTHADVLIIDQFAESLNDEMLVAAARAAITSGRPLKLVVMAASLSVDRLTRFFGELCAVARVAPHVDVAMRDGGALDDAAVGLARTHGDGLVIVPGKAHVRSTAARLADLLRDSAAVVALTADDDSSQQQRAFERDRRPKVIVTTEVVPVRANWVVDYGRRHRPQVRNQVEVVGLADASRADCLEAAGLAGGPEPVYVLGGTPFAERAPFAVAESARGHVERVVLQMAVNRIDAAKLPLLNRLDPDKVETAERTLSRLGALEHSGTATARGREVARLPVRPHVGVILLESARLGVQRKGMIAAALVLTRDLRLAGARKTTDAGSDLEAEIDAFCRAEEIASARHLRPLKDRLADVGISEAAFVEARRVRDELRRAVKPASPSSPVDEMDRVIRAYVAGQVDHLFHVDRPPFGDDVWWVGEDGAYRRPPPGSALRGAPPVLAGEPLDRHGQALVRLGVNVIPAWLERLAPDRVTRAREFGPFFDADAGTVREHVEYAIEIGGRSSTLDGCPRARPSRDAAAVLADALASARARHPDAERNLRDVVGLEELARSERGIRAPGHDELRERYRQLIGLATSTDELDGVRLRFADLVAPELRDAVDRAAPATIQVGGRDLAVSYRDRTPTLVLSRDDVGARVYRALPDVVRLNSGTSLKVDVVGRQWPPYTTAAAARADLVKHVGA